jgi:hypothetical protein
MISVQFKRESSGEFWNLTKLLQTCAEVQSSRTHYLDKGKMTTMATQYLPGQKRKPINLHLNTIGLKNQMPRDMISSV